jgi:hypothetical protein
MSTVTLRKTEAPDWIESVGAAYKVLLDGEEIGLVYKERRTERRTYAGRMYGYDTTATVWSYEATKTRRSYGLEEAPTRRGAIEDLLRWGGFGLDYGQAIELAASVKVVK